MRNIFRLMTNDPKILKRIGQNTLAHQLKEKYLFLIKRTEHYIELCNKYTNSKLTGEITLEEDEKGLYIYLVTELYKIKLFTLSAQGKIVYENIELWKKLRNYITHVVQQTSLRSNLFFTPEYALNFKLVARNSGFLLYVNWDHDDMQNSLIEFCHRFERSNNINIGVQQAGIQVDRDSHHRIIRDIDEEQERIELEIIERIANGDTKDSK